jgi:hypothetical protein
VALLAHAEREGHPERASTDDADSARHSNDIRTTGANMQAGNELRNTRRRTAGVSKLDRSFREYLKHEASRANAGA